MHFPMGNFDEEQLSILRTAIDLTCKELGIDEDDSVACERVAQAVLSFGAAGQFDIERLRIYAKSRALIGKFAEIRNSARLPHQVGV